MKKTQQQNTKPKKKTIKVGGEQHVKKQQTNTKKQPLQKKTLKHELQ